MGTDLSRSIAEPMSRSLGRSLSGGEFPAPPVQSGLIADWLPENAETSTGCVVTELRSSVDLDNSVFQTNDSFRPTLVRDPAFGDQPVPIYSTQFSSRMESASIGSSFSTALSARNAWSCSFALLLRDTGASLRRIFEISDGTNDNRVSIRFLDNGTDYSLRIERRVSATQDRLSGTVAIDYDQPTFVTVTYDGTTLRLWVNGAEDSTLSSTKSMASMPEMRVFAAYDDTGIPGGTLPFMLWYDRALSTEEIQSIDSWSADRWPNQVPAGTLTSDPVLVGLPAQSNGEDMEDWGISVFDNQAVDATGISRWVKIGGDLYPPAVAWIQGRGVGEVVWVYNVHGENDSLNESNANAYAAAYGGLIDDVRADCPNQDVRFIALLLNPTLDSTTYPYSSTVRAAIESVAASKTFVYTVSADDVNLRVGGRDSVHYRKDVVAAVRKRFEIIRGRFA